MISKAFSFILAIFTLFLILFPPLSQVVSSKSSSFEFLKHLQGSHKSDHVKGIHKLKKYLERFDYLDYSTGLSHAHDDTFDELKSAIKNYQLNYHLNVTGGLDSETVSEIMLSRCGVADIIKSTTRMFSGHGSSADAVSHYAFFLVMPRPSTKYHLTYTFHVSTPEMAKLPVHRAFKKWASKTHFTFSLLEGDVRKKADITIGFDRRHHGDGYSFDGPRGILGRACPPTNGTFNFDGNEQWTVGGGTEGHYDLETVALHGFGHLLGLEHSSVPDAIMFPSLRDGETRDLHKDDIHGIRFLYGF